MEPLTQHVQVPLDPLNQFAWDAAAIGISLTASLILLGIYRRGYPEIEQETRTRKELHDEGVMWMFRACTLWCSTYVVDIVGLIAFPDSQKKPLVSFLRVLLSLTNSVFFLLATSNIDAVKEDSSFPGTLLKRVGANWRPVLAALFLLAFALWLAGREGMYCQGLDALTNFLTILFLAWGFFKSFSERKFPIIARLSVLVFSIFLVAEFGEFVHAVNPAFLIARHGLFGTALAVGSDGTVSLLFIALTFSWVHEKSEKLADEIIKKDEIIKSISTSDPRDPLWREVEGVGRRKKAASPED